jgi:hypothetical protein
LGAAMPAPGFTRPEDFVAAITRTAGDASETDEAAEG